MIQTQTVLNVADNTGVVRSCVYSAGWLTRKTANVGDIVVASVRRQPQELSKEK